jgi:peptidoglycan/xylan/chitin deacetylase (PgdA/CDA1 family)
MGFARPWAKWRGRYRRNIHRFFFRQPFVVEADVPLVSFTFDDFPRSALFTGGAILKRFGAAGTYYACFGLMGQQAPTGPIFLPEDLNMLLEQGHELGCHTFGHCHSWETTAGAFEASIVDNRRALCEHLPGAFFRTFSYPISEPRPRNKHKVAQHFACGRGGGQTINAGTTDLNCLRAFFLEQSRDNPEAVMKLIDRNRRARGWLIFATHDISNTPTPYGCTPDYLEEVVQSALSSGARILPVFQVLETLRLRNSQAVANFSARDGLVGAEDVKQNLL